MNLRDRYIVKPGRKFKLADRDPDDIAHFDDRSQAEDLLKKNTGKLIKLHDLLYADRRFALLIVLQAMDAGGKDGTIKHVMSGVNPQGCTVTSFKVPSADEAAHDFLWRVHKAVPARGDIGIFNRSHYEEVLVARVHSLVPEKVWSKRYGQINQFEEILAANNIRILKFFLHIGKNEQKKRFEERLRNPDKNWKASAADFQERKQWDEYQSAYEDALAKCSKKDAPWFVIPANNKWFRNLAVSQIIVDTLKDMDLQYPKGTPADVPSDFQKDGAA